MMINMKTTRRNVGLQLIIKTADYIIHRGLDIRQIPMFFLYHRAELTSQEIVQSYLAAPVA
jgi:hypothetical protein